MNEMSEPAMIASPAAPDGTSPAGRSGSLFAPERRKTLSLIGIAWLAVALLYMLPYLVSTRDRLNVEAILAHLLVAFVGMVFSILLLGAVARATGQNGYKTFAKSSAAVLLASAATSAIDIHVFRWTFALFGQEWGTPYLVNWTSNFAIFTSQYALIAIIFWLLETYRAHRRNEVELQSTQLKAARSEMAENAALLVALRYQLNPHFLFNTLNSISSLVVTGRTDQAEEMIGQLSDFLRVALADDSQAPQTLDQELETIEAYLNIERVRFGDRLVIEIACPADLRECQFPSFILQPLVENSIKYGVARSRHSVTIAIRANVDGGDLVVTVEDDGDAATIETHGHGIGLRNVQQRLSALYGDAGRFESVQHPSGFRSVVRVPLRMREPVEPVA